MSRPRSKGVLARGLQKRADGEMSFTKAIRAVFGDESAFFSAWGHYQLIRHAQGLASSDVASKMEKYLESEGQADFFKQACRCIAALPSKSQKDIQYARLAAQTIDRVLEQHRQAGRLQARYLDNQSALSVDFYAYPGREKVSPYIGRGELLFGSFNPEIAHGYSEDLTIYWLERVQRSIDVNYFNYKLHGAWVHHPNDTDETETPGYVPPNDILGLSSSDKGLDLVRFQFQGLTYAAVFPYGTARSAFSSSNPVVLDDSQVFERIRKQALLGVLKACPSGQACSLPVEVLNQFATKKAGWKLSWNQVGELETLLGPDKTLRAFGSDGAMMALPEAPKTVVGADGLVDSRIIVLNSNYATNHGSPQGETTAAVAEWCQGKKTCDYQFSTARLGDPFPGYGKNFSIEWRCTGVEKKVFEVSEEPVVGGHIFKLRCDHDFLREKLGELKAVGTTREQLKAVGFRDKDLD